jgi:hypothetical protein
MNTTPNLDDFAGAPLDDEDESVLEMLREVLDTVDPVPDALTDRAQYGMTVALLHAEIASIVEPEFAAGDVRGTDYDRATSITFASGGLTVMVTLEPTAADTATVRGWITAPGAEVELRERSRTRAVMGDDEGRFSFEHVSRGLVHLVIRPHGDARAVITPAFEV